MPSDPYTFTILKVLAADRSTLQLAKSYAVNDAGQLVRTEYDAGCYFAVSQHRSPTISEWADFMRAMSKAPHACIIRGEPNGVNIARARRLQTNFPDVPRCFILFDFDKVKLPRGADGAAAARALLPPAFHTAPCWWQRTGSYGVEYVGRKDGDDPWGSRIRLGFMLDTPLTGPQIKFWLREHRKIVDLAIYTSNQINYTAAPVFKDGAVDPVLACGEERFGTLDIDGAIVDEVLVPDEIAAYVPTFVGEAVTGRPASISEPMRLRLIEEADLCDTFEGNGLHGSVAQWSFDAFALGMDEQEIIDVARRTLERLGREPAKAGPEAERLLLGGKRKMADGTLTVSSHLNAAGDFDAIDPSAPEEITAPALTAPQVAAQTAAIIPWQTRLKITPSTGAFKPTIDNAAIIIHNHSSFLAEDGVCILAYDAFRDVPVWTAPPPWWRSRPANTNPRIGELGHPLTDDDGTALAVWLGHLDPSTPEGTPIHIGKGIAIDALIHVSRYRTVNPVVQYFEKCAKDWDGVNRLDKVLTEICHADPSKIVACWFRKWIMQAVARAYNPGAKCDGVLIFQGGEGAKKSSFFRTLCPFEQLFFEGTLDFRDKDSMQNIQGKLIVEMAEMSGTKKDIDVIKAYITKQDDSYRASFGRMTERHPRKTIFCGTTNDDDSLSAPGRRWWVVEIPNTDGKLGARIDLARTLAERDQWWGEAVVRYRREEQWWLEDDEDLKSRDIADGHGIGLEVSEEIAAWLNRPALQGGAKHHDIVRAMDIWCGPMGKTVGNWTGASGREVSRLMQHLKIWQRERVKISPGESVKVYVRRGSKMALDFNCRKDYLLHHAATSPDADQPAA